MKRKFFTTLAIFAALALTACGGKPAEGSEGQKSETPASQPSSKHTHKYENYTVTKEATCEEAGVETGTCECGETKTREIKALGHDWDNGVITKEATCSEPGIRTYTCSRCQQTKTEEIKADHVWGEATPVTGGEGEINHNEFTCTVCGAKKIEFAAKQDGAVVTGGLKSDSTYPDYMKLNTNNDSIEYTFSTTLSGAAQIYQRGVMDYWYDGSNNNEQRNYYAGKNNNDGNFLLEVNAAAVDYSWSANVTYADMLPGEAQGSYSPLGDALIGDCAIVASANTVKYTRKESYNMLIKDFVIIIPVAA